MATLHNNKGSNTTIIESHNWLIHLYYTRKEIKKCRDLINQELFKSKGMAQYPNLMQGIILREEGKLQDSLDYFQSGQNHNPGNIEILKQIAKSRLLCGKHEAAIEAYEKLEKLLKIPDWETCHNLGLCWYYLKNQNKAKLYFEQAIQLSKNFQSYHMLKKIYTETNDLNGAIETFSNALDNCGENQVLSLSLGLLYTNSKQPIKALEYLSSSLSLDSKSAQALLAVGYLMQIRDDVNIAINKYRTVSQLTPDSAALWNNIGLAFIKKRKYVAAVCCLKRANFLSPFDTKILYNLGFIHLMLQQYASAFHFLSTCLHTSSNSTYQYMLLAISLFYLNDWDNGKLAMEQACQLDSTDPLLPLNFSILLLKHNGDKSSIKLLLQEFNHRINLIQNKNNPVDTELIKVGEEISLQMEN